jgi:hypothetical protein
MSLRRVCSIVVATLALGAPGAEVRAEEPVAPRATAAGDEKSVAPADAKPAEKPRSEAVGVDVEAFAAPIDRVLARKLVVKRPPPVVVNDPNTQQFVAQMRPILVSELAFVRQMCDLPVEQRPQVRAAGEAALVDVARKIAGPRQQGLVFLGGLNRLPPEPRQAIREALAAALKRTLTADQMTRYAVESEKRIALRKRAAILSVVARLDDMLCLTETQRQELTKSFDEHWQTKWEQWLQMRAYGDQYFPLIPDQHVVPLLTSEQVAVWRGLQKVEMSVWSSGNGQAAEDDGWWGDEPLMGNAAAGVIFAQ